MTSQSVEILWDRLYEVFGDDLRGVIRYDSKKFDLVLRDDIDDRYTDLEDRRVVDDSIVTQIGAQQSQDTFKAGPLEGFVKIFEEAWVLTVPDSIPGKSGYIISIQRQGAETTIDEFERCLEIVARN